MRAGTAMSWVWIVAVVARAWNLEARVPAARVRLNEIAARTSQAAFAVNSPDGRWATGPFFSSAMTFVNAERTLTSYCRLNLDPLACFRWLLDGLEDRGWWSGPVCSGAVGVPVQGDDVGVVGVVDEAVDGRGGHDVVAEGLAPAGEREVGRDDHGPGLVAGCDELEEQRGRCGVEREVADLVDLCRHRHRSTYADLAIMPIRPDDDVQMAW